MILKVSFGLLFSWECILPNIVCASLNAPWRHSWLSFSYANVIVASSAPAIEKKSKRLPNFYRKPPSDKVFNNSLKIFFVMQTSHAQCFVLLHEDLDWKHVRHLAGYNFCYYVRSFKGLFYVTFRLKPAVKAQIFSQAWMCQHGGSPWCQHDARKRPS